MSDAIRYIARAPQVAARMIGDEMMIMSGADSSLFTLNATAAVLWQAADGVTPLADIVEQRICAAFDVDARRRAARRRGTGRGPRAARHSARVRCADPGRAPRRRRTPMSGLMREMGAKALRLGIPLGVQLDLTYRCNERCVHCYLDHDDHGEMTTAEIKDLLDQLADAGRLLPDPERRRDLPAQGPVRDRRARAPADCSA